MIQNYSQIETVKEYMAEVFRIIRAPISIGYISDVKFDNGELVVDEDEIKK
jgi:hypothetical protein